MIPYFNQRMATVGLIIRSEDPNKNVEINVPAVDYFRRFYGDTILGGNMAALMCGYSFFGADHLVFGTDYPFGGKFTETRMATEVATMDQMPIPPYEKDKIVFKNTIELLKIKK
jgi:aminocarboxymuconate-semialdehyde decarboxylase